MVGILANTFIHDITWWPVVADGTGGDVPDAPELIRGRWEDRREVYIGQLDRREQISKAVVHLDRAVGVGDYVALGDFTSVNDPTMVPTADKVQQYRKIPDLRNLEVMHRIVL